MSFFTFSRPIDAKRIANISLAYNVGHTQRTDAGPLIESHWALSQGVGVLEKEKMFERRVSFSPVSSCSDERSRNAEPDNSLRHLKRESPAGFSSSSFWLDETEWEWEKAVFLSLSLSFFHYPTWKILIDHLRIAREYSSPSIWLPASSSSSSIY